MCRISSSVEEALELMPLPLPIECSYFDSCFECMKQLDEFVENISAILVFILDLNVRRKLSREC